MTSGTPSAARSAAEWYSSSSLDRSMRLAVCTRGTAGCFGGDGDGHSESRGCDSSRRQRAQPYTAAASAIVTNPSLTVRMVRRNTLRSRSSSVAGMNGGGSIPNNRASSSASSRVRPSGSSCSSGRHRAALRACHSSRRLFATCCAESIRESSSVTSWYSRPTAARKACAARGPSCCDELTNASALICTCAKLA